MGSLDSPLGRRLAEVLPPDQISVDPKVLQSNSQDYAWFSNVLDETLDGYCAEMVAWPADEEQLAGVLAAAYETRTPVTVRGGGTGNYGQCVPLMGGLVVNMGRLNRVLEIGDGYARVQAGVKLVDLDRAAHASGQEIRIYPSTYLTATVVGFVGGGSGGIGSCTYGFLIDGNVLSVTVYPVNAAPSPLTARGDALWCYVHAYGTTGAMSEAMVPLVPRHSWEQAVVSFPEILSCHAFCLELLTDERIDKRLISTAEPGVVRHFMRARLPFKPDRTSALLMIGAGQLDLVTTLAARHGGELDFALPPESKTRLSDFTWNHTTLWAKKANPELTYLQAGFDVDRYEQQVRAIKAEYGDEFAIHGEYTRAGGAPFASALPIIPYKGRADLEQMIAFLESIGVFIANPHTYILEEGSRTDNVADLLATRRQNDPAGLLNPGKLAAAGLDGRAIPVRKESTLGLARRRRPLSDLEG